MEAGHNGKHGALVPQPAVKVFRHGLGIATILHHNMAVTTAMSKAKPTPILGNVIDRNV